jgi:multidrug efflux system membrane fusion protein
MSRSVGLWIAAFVLLNGCKPNAPSAAPSGPTAVPVSLPIQRDVTDYVEYTGRTDAVETVNIKARVTGYIVEAPFKEGAEIGLNATLFKIDPRPYQAQLDQAEAQSKVAVAQAELARTNLDRLKKTGTSASPAELDQAEATLKAAEAQVKAAAATAEVYRINLAYCEIKSPIAGQISRAYYTVGNLVNQDQTLLTTVVTVDDMHVYFDMDERTLLRIRTAINQGKIQPRSETNSLPVLMGLEGEDGYPHAGNVDFVNNVVNPSTGTISVRCLFKNPKPANGRRLLSPGMFVRIKMPIGKPHASLLVVDRAIGSDQGLKYVYVLDAENKIRYRRVTVGTLEDDGLRVIESGLKPGEKVAVGAIQQLRPGIDVEPEMIPMPTPGAPTPPLQAPKASEPKR